MDLSKLSALPYFMARFQDSAARYPQQLMLVDERHPEGLTRAEVDEQSARVYAYLTGHGLGREDMVMICLPRGVETAIAMIGVWKAGAALTVLEDDLPPERVAFIRRDCGCALVIDSALWPEIMRTPPLPGYVQAGDHDAAFAVYTSGSTGTPKGVLQEYGCFRLHALFVADLSCIPEQTWTEAMIPPFHTLAGMNIINRLLRSLDTVYILPREIVSDPPRLNRYFTEHGITRTFLPPSLLRAGGCTLSPSVRFAAVGGESANGLFLDNVTLECAYALSESGYPLCRFILDRPYNPCPVGKPTSDLIALRLLDKAGQEVPAGEEGEICFENPFMRCYINRPQESREAFRGGVFHSGDLGRWDENGNLIVTGRANDMIKVNGNRVEPAEIESVFRKLTGHSWCAVKGFEIGTRTLLCLYYHGETDFDDRALRGELGAYLPDYMIPAKFLRVETVPLLASGKTDRAALPTPDFTENRPAFAPPVTETEKALCRAFETVFDIVPIGLDDDFFDVGGDSLTAMSLLTEAELPGLSTLDIYEHRTVRKIAEALAQRQAEEANEDYAVSEARERAVLHPVSDALSQNLALPEISDLHFPNLLRFAPTVDAQKLCDALNRAIANRSVLSMVFETDGAGQTVMRYDAAFMPHYEVKRLTEAEFEAERADLIQPFQIYGASLVHAGVYETECSVYLFVDVHHVIMDGNAMLLLYDDIEKAYHGEPLAQDTYCTYLARQERERATERYWKARRGWMRILDDERWRFGFTPDQSDGPSDMAVLTCHRAIMKEEIRSLSERLGLSETLICAGLMFLTMARVDGEGNCLCSFVYHDRGDGVGRNAFGNLISYILFAAKVRGSGNVAGFFKELKANWIDSTASLRASYDAGISMRNSAQMMKLVYEPHKIVGDVMTSLGAKREKLQFTAQGSKTNQFGIFSEQSDRIAPMLMLKKKYYSPEKQAAILDALETVIDRTVAVEDPETTTVAELLT